MYHPEESKGGNDLGKRLVERVEKAAPVFIFGTRRWLNKGYNGLVRHTSRGLLVASEERGPLFPFVQKTREEKQS
jgi:hypothetical protein